MPVDPSKHAALLAILDGDDPLTNKPFVCEYLKVEWNNGAETKYYATSDYADLSPYRDVKNYTGGAYLDARIQGDPFRNFEINGDLRTENIDIVFDDTDGEIKAKFQSFGAARCELFYYYPQVDLNVSVWWGQVLPPQIVGRFTQRTILTNGYRSKERFLPNGQMPKECPWTFGGKLSTLDKVRTNGCPYDIHLPGGSVGLLDPTTGLPFKDCPKLSKADSIARLGTDKYYGGVALNAAPIPITNAGTLAVSKGNATIRNKATTWIFGTKYFRGGELLIHRHEGNHPTEDYIRMVFRVSEGSIFSISDIKVGERVIGFEHINKLLGKRGQPLMSYSNLTDNFSSRACVLTVYGPFPVGSVAVNSLPLSCMVLGNDEVAVYTDETTFTRQFTNDRIWSLLEMYTNQKCGLGTEAGLFWINKYLTASEWGRKNVTFTHTFPDGEVRLFNHQRTSFDAAMEGRPAVEQIADVCRSGRISVPFQYDGKYSIEPFRVFTDDELAAAPVFYDSGPNLNIEFAGDALPVEFKPVPPDKLVNEITLTFEEANNFDIARPITVDDPDQKAQASKLLGEEAFQTVPKQFSAFGIRNEPEAVKLAYYLLWFGEFESGGTKNNCPAKHIVAFERTLGMTRYGPYKLELTTMAAPIGPNGSSQVMTATAVGTASGSGNITVTITAAGLVGTPLGVTVGILSGDTPAVWAGKVRAALKLNTDVNAFFFIGGTGADITLASRARLAHDPTWNTAIAAGTTGITADPTSVTTTEGVADHPFQWFRCLNIKKIGRGLAEVTGIAYNRALYEVFEDESPDPPPTEMCAIDADCPEGYVCRDGICVPVDPPPICPVTFGTVVYNEATGMIEVPIDPC